MNNYLKSFGIATQRKGARLARPNTTRKIEDVLDDELGVTKGVKQARKFGDSLRGRLQSNYRKVGGY